MSVNMHDAERPMAMLGVPGRLLSRMSGNPGFAAGVWVNQRWISEARPARGYGKGAMIQAEVRLDDGCKNGHATFAITADIFARNRNGGKIEISGGCCHDDIAAAFPELAGLVRWHLTSTDGPMHYIANTIYHAGDRDHYGRRAGEPSTVVEVVQFGDVPIRHPLKDKLAPFLRSVRDYDRDGIAQALEVISVSHASQPGERFKFAPKYDFAGRGPLPWHGCAFDTEEEASRFADAFLNHGPKIYGMATAWSEGKARDLAAARSTAIWPDATDEELSAEPDVLRAALEARHPRLMEQFRADMEAAGLFLFPADYVAPREEA
jgi:hypothetical protein